MNKSPNKERPKVLIIDDQVDILTLASTLFEHAGADVTTAAESALGVKLSNARMENKSPFDLVIVDIHMPAPNGFQVAEQIRQSGYKGPIVAFTALPTMKWKKEAEAAGITTYFSKTTMKADLIRALLEQHCAI